MSTKNTDTVRELLNLFETMNVSAALDYFTDDASYRFGNYPAARGKEQIRQVVAASHLDAIKGVKFEVKEMLETDNVVVCELLIHYTRTDDSTLSLPCTDLFEFEGGLISDMKIFMDATPLFARSGTA